MKKFINISERIGFAKWLNLDITETTTQLCIFTCSFVEEFLHVFSLNIKHDFETCHPFYFVNFLVVVEIKNVVNDLFSIFVLSVIGCDEEFLAMEET